MERERKIFGKRNNKKNGIKMETGATNQRSSEGKMKRKRDNNIGK